jgi:hypothetical protein
VVRSLAILTEGRHGRSGYGATEPSSWDMVWTDWSRSSVRRGEVSRKRLGTAGERRSYQNGRRAIEPTKVRRRRKHKHVRWFGWPRDVRWSCGRKRDIRLGAWRQWNGSRIERWRCACELRRETLPGVSSIVVPANHWKLGLLRLRRLRRRRGRSSTWLGKRTE